MKITLTKAFEVLEPFADDDVIRVEDLPYIRLEICKARREFTEDELTPAENELRIEAISVLEHSKIVKYANPNAGEEDIRFRLLEHRGDRVSIELIDSDYPIAPIEVIATSEISPA